MRSINQANVSGSEVRKILIPLLATETQERIAELVNTSYRVSKESETAYPQAQKLLDQAKSRVEQLIEEAVQA